MTATISPPLITAAGLVPPLNGKMPRTAPDHLSDIDKIVVLTILQSLTEDPWVLVDRNPFEKQGQSSKIYIALRRRGFDVVVRHVDGIKNYWAKWPHPLPAMPLLPVYKGDQDRMYGASSYGEDR